MAYSLETSSVKTIVPGAEVSGFCDVVARQKINELSGEVPQLSAGEGIDISNADGKTVITNNISAGTNISLVYDMETNTYRIDSNGGNTFPMVSSDDSQLYSRYIYELDGVASGIKSTYTTSYNAMTAISSSEVSPNKIVLQTSSINATYPSEVIITDDKVSKLWYADTYRSKKWDDIIKPTIEWNSATDFHSIGSGAELRVWYNNGEHSASYSWSGIKLNTKYTNTSSLFINSTGVSSYSAGGMTLPQSATWKQIINAATGSQGKTYTGVAPIQVNNTTDQISITGESLSAGPGIDMFSSGGYVVISANGGSTFPITGTNGTTGFTANMDCSSMMLTTGASPAGGYVKQTTRGVQYEAYPATDVSASWYNIINGANNRSNCYCIKLNSTNTAASLEDYSAYDRVTVIHAQDYGPDYLLHWDGKTKTFPSGLYCELAKVKDDVNEDKWTFLNSGWTFDFWWDYD